MDQEIIPINPSSLAIIGQIANEYAAQNVFSEYQGRKSANTLLRQENDLKLFATYLTQAGVVIDGQDLFNRPEAWDGVTYGLVDGFVRWMLNEGYAIGSVNVRLSTIKMYCKLCSKAKVLSTTEYALINLVVGYQHSEGRNVDERREKTRKGRKKADPVSISQEQAKQLKNQPDTPQGRRDALLMCLLLDHGLRCGEIATLKPEHFTLSEDSGFLVFYRKKVNKTQTHRLTRDTLVAVKRYLETCQPVDKLLIGSRKGGAMQGMMGERAITLRAMTLAKRIGIKGLSAHDGRHAWATFAVRNGTDIKSLQDAGGWNSPAMPLRYVESNAIANEGVKLG